MGDTKERILLTALRLFSLEGYEAVSVSDVASALGITKGALYRHYRSKRDIFESILRRMEQRDAAQAGEHGMPEEARAEAEEAYGEADLGQAADFAKAMFRYWTRDEFAARFRRMLTLEQYRDPEMGRLFQQYLASGPMDYMADLFEAHGLPRPRETAARFYGPMFLLYSVYDASEDGEAVIALADRLLDAAAEELIESEKE